MKPPSLSISACCNPSFFILVDVLLVCTLVLLSVCPTCSLTPLLSYGGHSY